METICRAVFWIYVIVSALALLAIPASEEQMFGLWPDPLAGVFAILLAQPWVSLIGRASHGAMSGYGLVIGGMVANAAIIRFACRLMRR